jgi:tetratricopeptide (TPR) repeat protein
MEKCPVCGSTMGKDAKACSICGTAFNAAPPQCPLCDSPVDAKATECPNCGSELEGLKSEAESAVQEITQENIESVATTTSEDKGAAEAIAKSVFVDVELEELVKLPGIGPLRAKILFDAGFTDLRKLKQASVVELMNIRGIGRKAAGEIKAALREYTLEEIRSVELTEETVGSELQCPLCATIVSAYESSCYECGCIFKPEEGGVGDSDRLALSYYDSKLLRTPDNKDLWYARGATLVKMEEYEHAISSFNRAIEIDPSYQTAWMSKADVYNKLGDSSKAAECYSHIITSASGGHMPGAKIDNLTDSTEAEEDEDLALEPPAPSEPIEEETEVAQPIKMAELDLSQKPEEAEAEPEVLKPGSADFKELDMDYEKTPPEKPNYDSMSEAELKKELSKRATHVKPYLALAKEMDVDINHAKRLISRAVTESKQNEIKIAIQLMDEGIEFAETEFRRKVTEDIDNLATVIRDLKSTGTDVSVAADLIISSKTYLESGEIAKSVEQLKKCLELVERVA